jgi:hypothetical protein
MKKLLLFLGATLCLLPFNSAAAGAQSPSRPVALVFFLQGEATHKAPAQRRRPLHLFDRLAAGTIVEVRPGSRLALAFANGHRYELGEGSRATLGSEDLAARSGPVRILRAVPPFPIVAAIAEGENAGESAGAVPVRGRRIEGLYPGGGAATLAGATVLRFKPVDGAGTYRIEVEDGGGTVVFATETAASPANLPAEVLQAGMPYSWRVRTVEQVGPIAEGKASFVTLSAQLAEAREELRRSIETMGDAASLALLAEVDRSLGLRLEARDELRAAVRAMPEDARLAASLARLERRLPYFQSP